MKDVQDSSKVRLALMFKHHLDVLVPQFDEKAISVSQVTNTLVLGIKGCNPYCPDVRIMEL